MKHNVALLVVIACLLSYPAVAAPSPEQCNIAQKKITDLLSTPQHCDTHADCVWYRISCSAPIDILNPVNKTTRLKAQKLFRQYSPCRFIGEYKEQNEGCEAVMRVADTEMLSQRSPQCIEHRCKEAHENTSAR